MVPPLAGTGADVTVPAWLSGRRAWYGAGRERAVDEPVTDDRLIAAVSVGPNGMLGMD